MRVEFIYKTGRVTMMEKRYAEILQKLKKGSYTTKEMNQSNTETTTLSPRVDTVDDLSEMTVAQLRELAIERGIELPAKANKSLIVAILTGV